MKSCGNPTSGLQDTVRSVCVCTCFSMCLRKKCVYVFALACKHDDDGMVPSSVSSFSSSSDKDLGECVGPGAGDEGLGGMEGHVVDRLVMLLPVGGDLLDTRPVVQHPQTHRAVMTCRGRHAHGRISPPALGFKSSIIISHLVIIYFMPSFSDCIFQ